MISTNLQHLDLLKGRVSMILTVSPMLQSFVSSCATYFLVFNTNLPYNGCFTLVVWETTIDFSILLLVTTPILSFLKFLFSIFQLDYNYCNSLLLSSVATLAIDLLTVLICNGFSIGEIA